MSFFFITIERCDRRMRHDDPNQPVAGGAGPRNGSLRLPHLRQGSLENVSSKMTSEFIDFLRPIAAADRCATRRTTSTRSSRPRTSTGASTRRPSTRPCRSPTRARWAAAVAKPLNRLPTFAVFLFFAGLFIATVDIRRFVWDESTFSKKMFKIHNTSFHFPERILTLIFLGGF